jgi:hypothetical protein
VTALEQQVVLRDDSDHRAVVVDDRHARDAGATSSSEVDGPTVTTGRVRNRGQEFLRGGESPVSTVIGGSVKRRGRSRE